MNDREPWKRVALYIADRRVELGYTTAKSFAAAAGISRPIIADLEKGERVSYSRTTIALLERGLQWEVGSVRAILAGGQPGPRPTDQATSRSQSA
jgi:transcriptional regulator with XRE-family HTH domain